MTGLACSRSHDSRRKPASCEQPDVATTLQLPACLPVGRLSRPLGKRPLGRWACSCDGATLSSVAKQGRLPQTTNWPAHRASQRNLIRVGGRLENFIIIMIKMTCSACACHEPSPQPSFRRAAKRSCGDGGGGGGGTGLHNYDVVSFPSAPSRQSRNNRSLGFAANGGGGLLPGKHAAMASF